MADRDNPDNSRDKGPAPGNISTEHQGKGDARRPDDTLNRPKEQVHPAREFDPAGDVGRAEPGKEN